MPPAHSDEGIRAAIELRSSHPYHGVIVQSQFAEPTYVLTLFEHGSEYLGHLLKERISPSDLDRAIRSVADGGSSVDARIVEVLVQARTSRPSAIDQLTPRETEVPSW